ncbi:hypothetical protein [uncultured Phenylobacterium sp.]|uniref:terminase small subunit-like protein n=1 Tax=uncultured Phenylobacterium sp. TaxID=349273 RepID=UPI0025FA8A37|nr:hypothetical protein [uncultured Phenylobacterium sp.]
MPSGYTPAERRRLLAALLERRAAGESFDAICATPGWPSRPTIRKWLRRAPDLRVPRLRRPSVRWSPRIADEICERFHVQSLREICEDPAMPDRTTLAQWRRKRPAFAARLEAVRAEARQPRTGRRSTYCDLIADDVADAVFEAGSIGAACRGPDHPPARTVRDWARAHPDFGRTIGIAMDMAREIRHGPLIAAVDAWLADPNATPETAPLRPKPRKPRPSAPSPPSAPGAKSGRR